MRRATVGGHGAGLRDLRCSRRRRDAAAQAQAPAFTADAVMAHVKVLASDEFEGRAPGTKGEDLTVAYISDQFRKVGLKPGHTDGTYIQKVPMVGITADPATSLVFKKGGVTQALAFKDDVVAWTKRVEERVSIDASDVVFVGYGVQAPEFQWDDYKGVDLAGKTVIMLVNDPPVPDPADPSRLDPKTFGGRAMTYYGRWTYKYEMGAEKQAAAVFIVHETGPAAYPFSVVQSKVTEQFDLVTADKNRGRPAIEGWITTRPGEAAVCDGGPGLRRVEGAGRDAGLHAGADGRHGVDDAAQPYPDPRLPQRRRHPSGQRSRAEGPST